MATFSKTYFHKALLNCQFDSLLIYDIVYLVKKGILTCREAAYLNKSFETDGIMCSKSDDFNPKTDVK